MPPKTVPPTVEYLQSLETAGHRPIDIEVVMLKPGLYQIWVHTMNHGKIEFRMEADRRTLATHHREAVAYTGFGSEGLANLIYAEACEKRNETELPSNRIRISLSEACLARVETSIQKWLHYGFDFRVRKELTRISYEIEVLDDVDGSNH